MHGRKPAFMNRLLKHPPAPVDNLLTEGTMLGRGSQKFPDERAVEHAMVELMNSTDAATFLVASSQNLDRLVSAFRACTGIINKANLRKIDCWGLAFFDYCKEEARNQPTKLILEVPRKASASESPNVEALRRRVSYLNLADDLNIQLLSCGVEIPSYPLADLLKRPANEIVRVDHAERGDHDKPGRLEKDFQAYLFGKGKNDTIRTNERLVILGEDFRDLNKKKTTFVMEREFPTSVFDEKVSAHARILPTDFIDVVSFDKWQKLALIELKVNDSCLPVISQAVDYALFFTSYQKQLWDVLKNKLGRRPQKKLCLYLH